MSGSGEKSEDKRGRLDKLGGSLSDFFFPNTSPSRQKKAKGLEGFFKKSSSQSALPVSRKTEESEAVPVGVAASSSSTTGQLPRSSSSSNSVHSCSSSSSSSLNFFICESEESRAPTPAKPESRLTDLELLINEKTEAKTEAKTRARRDAQEKDNINEKMYNLLRRALLHLNEEYMNPTDDMGRKKGLQTFIITLLKSYPSMTLTDADWNEISKLIRDQNLENLYRELTEPSNANASESSSSSSSSSSRLFPAAPEYPVLRYLTQWHDLREAAESSAAPSP